ncbi:MAG: ATP-NAD kinase family protein [Thermoplasmata archaeon]
MRAGFLVNPIAGMGGAVGLKGTDGEDIQKQALQRGAKKTSPERARAALAEVRAKRLALDFVTCAGDMGKEELDAAGIPSETVYTPARPSSRNDTILAAMAFVENGAELIVFAGGDGTARDVHEAVGQKVPIVGIPAGVKMHSAVFAHTPEQVADLLESFARTRNTRDAEVMDVDEESFRKGVLKAMLYGIAKVPDDIIHIQPGKASYHSGSADDEAAEIGQYVADTVEQGVRYIVGPGSTTAKIAEALGCEKTVLGVDVYSDGKRCLTDATAGDLARLLSTVKKAKIIVTPIGAQGFFFGRGNQQISPDVIRRVGVENVIIVATPSKLRDTPILRVDTGDVGLDRELRRPVKVITGYRRKRLMRVE